MWSLGIINLNYCIWLNQWLISQCIWTAQTFGLMLISSGAPIAVPMICYWILFYLDENLSVSMHCKIQEISYVIKLSHKIIKAHNPKCRPCISQWLRLLYNFNCFWLRIRYLFPQSKPCYISFSRPKLILWRCCSWALLLFVSILVYCFAL